MPIDIDDLKRRVSALERKLAKITRRKRKGKK